MCVVLLSGQCWVCGVSCSTENSRLFKSTIQCSTLPSLFFLEFFARMFNEIILPSITFYHSSQKFQTGTYCLTLTSVILPTSFMRFHFDANITSLYNSHKLPTLRFGTHINSWYYSHKLQTFRFGSRISFYGALTCCRVGFAPGLCPLSSVVSV